MQANTVLVMIDAGIYPFFLASTFPRVAEAQQQQDFFISSFDLYIIREMLPSLVAENSSPAISGLAFGAHKALQAVPCPPSNVEQTLRASTADRCPQLSDCELFVQEPYIIDQWISKTKTFPVFGMCSTLTCIVKFLG
jgi:hypothetical protein